jgi:hypothetical protein
MYTHTHTRACWVGRMARVVQIGPWHGRPTEPQREAPKAREETAREGDHFSRARPARVCEAARGGKRGRRPAAGASFWLAMVTASPPRRGIRWELPAVPPPPPFQSPLQFQSRVLSSPLSYEPGDLGGDNACGGGAAVEEAVVVSGRGVPTRWCVWGLHQARAVDLVFFFVTV